MIRKYIGRRLSVILTVFIMIHGVCEGKIYGGAVENSDGVGFMCGAPTGLMPVDIAPEKVCYEHIASLLDEFKEFVEKGEISSAAFYTATVYLMSFITDERYCEKVYRRYSKPLFETYGEKEAEVVRLYYLTGGSLEELRKLYARSTDEKVRSAIESCFLDASEPLENAGDLIGEPSSEKRPLTIKISYERKLMENTSLGEPPSHEESDSGSRFVSNEYEIAVEFENTASSAVSCSIPMWASVLTVENFNIRRTDDVPVAGLGDYAKMQDIVLYPGDRLVKKVGFKLENKIGLFGHSSESNGDSVFKSCFSGNYVTLGHGDCIAIDPDGPVFLDIQFEQEFVLGRPGKGQKIGVRRSNVLRLEYASKNLMTPKISKDEHRKNLWQMVNEEMERRGLSLKKKEKGSECQLESTLNF